MMIERDLKLFAFCHYYHSKEAYFLNMIQFYRIQNFNF